MITVYVSSTSSPATSRADFEIDLSDGDSLPTDVQLYAAATDSDDAGATFSFSWHLLKKPEGSSAALDNASLQNPTLESVDVWGDYRLFCIATNTSSAATSQRDPLQAGSSAFVKVFVRSERLGLVKPAAGERDWNTYAYEWVDAIENMDADVADHETRITTLEAATPVMSLEDLDDVVLTSLTSGDALVWDGTNWVNDVISSGGGGTLSVKADADTGTVAVDTEALAFTDSDGIVITGSSATPGQYTVNVGLASTLAVDISGNATTATSAGSADVAIQLDTPNVLSLTGDLSGSATIGGTNFAPSLNATIQTGAVENSMLQNSSITFSDSFSGTPVSLGGTLTIQGTTNEVEVLQSIGTFTIGLPSSINANAATATALQTSRTISLTGGATGSASFDGSANASISTTLATPTTSVRGGVLLDQVSAYGNSSAYLLNRERVSVSSFVDNTHFENSPTDNHAVDHDGVSEDSGLATNLILQGVCVMRNPFHTTAHIDSISAVISDSGVEGGDGYYQLELLKFTNQSAVRNNSFTATGVLLTLTSATDHGPGTDYVDNSSLLDGETVVDGGYIAFRVNNSPKYLGHSLHIQVNFSREIGVGGY